MTDSNEPQVVFVDWDWSDPANLDEELIVEAVFSKLFATMRSLASGEPTILEPGDGFGIGRSLVAAMAIIEKCIDVIATGTGKTELEVINLLESGRPRGNRDDDG